ncbi:MAG: Fur family transcriptional regulator [Pseudomonadota bacterium]|nr:Fur family transcriptional regulator [Pseudomonadota bacterium]
MTGKEAHSHDHGSTMEEVIAAVEKQCKDNGLKLTPARRKVMEILLSQDGAMGAYDILPLLEQAGLGGQPPVVYRALDFLQKHGFVHKIERLNAFVACTHPGSDHSPAFMICRDCSLVVETESHPVEHMKTDAENKGFAIDHTVVELEGVCADCQPEK